MVINRWIKYNGLNITTKRQRHPGASQKNLADKRVKELYTIANIANIHRLSLPTSTDRLHSVYDWLSK